MPIHNPDVEGNEGDGYGGFSSGDAGIDTDSLAYRRKKQAEKKAAAAAHRAQWEDKGLVDPYGSGDANQLAAKIIRSQYEHWESFYKPIELQAINMLSFKNPEVLTTAVDQAEKTATGQADAMEGLLARRTASLGISPTAQQDQVSDRIQNLSRAASIASAQNQARANVREQDDQILLGVSPNPNIVRGAVASS
jgi:hypothetical protein